MDTWTALCFGNTLVAIDDKARLQPYDTLHKFGVGFILIPTALWDVVAPYDWWGSRGERVTIYLMWTSGC